MAQILIIEDSNYQRNKIRRVLEAEGHSLLEASNGREGVEMIAANQPECVLLDLLMPEMDGFEVLQSLQEQGITIPVVVLTADIQETTRQQCLELGASAFVNKPLRRDDLLQAVAKALHPTCG